MPHIIILNICIFQKYPKTPKLQKLLKTCPENVDPKNIGFIKSNVNALNNFFKVDDNSTAASQPAALFFMLRHRFDQEIDDIVFGALKLCGFSHWS